MIEKPTLREWLVVSFKIGALSVGSSGRLAILKDELVGQRRWLTSEEFHEILTISQVFPGPNLVNLVVYIGYYFFGFRGTLMGLLMLGVPGTLAALLIYEFIDFQQAWIRELFIGFSIGSFTVFFVFIFALFEGFKSTSAKQNSLRPIKLYLRVLLFASFFAWSFVAKSVVPIIALGAIACVLVEFMIAERSP